MTIATLVEVAVWDEEGAIEGLQFDGRERRIQEWREKKDEEEFDRLVAKIRQHNNYRRWYERHKYDSSFRKRINAHSARMRSKHGKRRNAEARAKRKQEHEANPIVNLCEECHKEFVREYGFKRKRTAKFCSRKCRNRNHGRKRDRSGSRDRKAEVLALVKSRDSVSAKEAEAVLDMSLATVRTLLSVLAKDGTINKHTDESPFRYSIW